MIKTKYVCNFLAVLTFAIAFSEPLRAEPDYIFVGEVIRITVSTLIVENETEQREFRFGSMAPSVGVGDYVTIRYDNDSKKIVSLEKKRSDDEDVSNDEQKRSGQNFPGIIDDRGFYRAEKKSIFKNS